MMLTKDMRLPESEEDLPSTDLEQRVSMAERYSQLGESAAGALLASTLGSLPAGHPCCVLLDASQSLANLPEQCWNPRSLRLPGIMWRWLQRISLIGRSRTSKILPWNPTSCAAWKSRAWSLCLKHWRLMRLPRSWCQSLPLASSMASTWFCHQTLLANGLPAASRMNGPKCRKTWRVSFHQDMISQACPKPNVNEWIPRRRQKGSLWQSKLSVAWTLQRWWCRPVGLESWRDWLSSSTPAMSWSCWTRQPVMWPLPVTSPAGTRGAGGPRKKQEKVLILPLTLFGNSLPAVTFWSWMEWAWPCTRHWKTWRRPSQKRLCSATTSWRTIRKAAMDLEILTSNSSTKLAGELREQRWKAMPKSKTLPLWQRSSLQMPGTSMRFRSCGLQGGPSKAWPVSSQWCGWRAA